MFCIYQPISLVLHTSVLRELKFWATVWSTEFSQSWFTIAYNFVLPRFLRDPMIYQLPGRLTVYHTEEGAVHHCSKWIGSSLSIERGIMPFIRFLPVHRRMLPLTSTRQMQFISRVHQIYRLCPKSLLWIQPHTQRKVSYKTNLRQRCLHPFAEEARMQTSIRESDDDEDAEWIRACGTAELFVKWNACIARKKYWTMAVRKTTRLHTHRVDTYVNAQNGAIPYNYDMLLAVGIFGHTSILRRNYKS